MFMAVGCVSIWVTAAKFWYNHGIELLNIYNLLPIDLSNSSIELTISEFYVSFLDVSFNEQQNYGVRAIETINTLKGCHIFLSLSTRKEKKSMQPA